ncbi:MAG: UDP-N-acetylglucosamine 2-epimerase (non-hydrolyzing) [Methanobrevibacter sp.]|jgi:UDP-N-acetylglucosamine 2-epimerase (non-hydrolysing)|nr:UDP-N-acetylglucosamine 2-epimerase (non-hydrolyzing) [Methanobrevibacter sp.]
MKIVLMFGTRPEIIKMAPIIDEVFKKSLKLILIQSGQHYDYEMSDQFFEDLKLPSPDYNLSVGSGKHGEQTGKMMERIEKVLIEEKPDVVLVHGDTNTALSGFLVASKLHVPVCHVEAGLRSYSNTTPEEINRKMIDVCCELYFAPTEESAINLSLEGVSREKIFITGNTIVDVCLRNRLKISKKQLNKNHELRNLINLDNIITLTIHRAENVDNKKSLNNIVDVLCEMEHANIIFPIHPRTKKALKRFDLYEKLFNLNHVHSINPLGYLDFLLLLSNSSLILTDSGGLQEEAIILNIPILTLRNNTDRPETVTAGGNILVGFQKEKILKLTNCILNNEDIANKMKNAKNPYGNGNSAEKIVDIILNSYENNELKIESVENIINNFTLKIVEVKENINVFDFEKKNNAKIRIVYDKNKSKFPINDLNLKNKFILYDQIG